MNEAWRVIKTIVVRVSMSAPQRSAPLDEVGIKTIPSSGPTSAAQSRRKTCSQAAGQRQVMQLSIAANAMQTHAISAGADMQEKKTAWEGEWWLQ